MIDLLLPATNAGVAAQFGLVMVVGLIGLLLARRHPDLRLLVVGLIILLVALTAVRAVH